MFVDLRAVTAEHITIILEDLLKDKPKKCILESENPLELLEQYHISYTHEYEK